MNDHSVMVRADAKAVGMVSAFRVGGTRKSPNTYVSASPCISYFNAGKSDATIFRNTRTRKPNRRTITVQDHGQTYAERVAQLGAIGNVE